MRERKRRHDDLHRPMGGKGKRATPPRARLVQIPPHDCAPDAAADDNHAQCKVCGAWLFLNCDGRWQRSTL